MASIFDNLRNITRVMMGASLPTAEDNETYKRWSSPFIIQELFRKWDLDRMDLYYYKDKCKYLEDKVAKLQLKIDSEMDSIKQIRRV